MLRNKLYRLFNENLSFYHGRFAQCLGIRSLGIAKLLRFLDAKIKMLVAHVPLGRLGFPWKLMWPTVIFLQLQGWEHCFVLFWFWFSAEASVSVYRPFPAPFHSTLSCMPTYYFKANRRLLLSRKVPAILLRAYLIRSASSKRISVVANSKSTNLEY